MLLTIVFAIGVCVSVLRILWQRRRFYWLHRQLPGRWGYPFIGLAHLVADRAAILQTIEFFFEKHGPILYTWLGPIPVLLLSDSQAIKEVLTTQEPKKGLLYDAIDDGVGRGLFSMEGEEWAYHRRLLNPCFNQKVLNGFISIFNEETEALIEVLEEMVDKAPVDLSETLRVFSMAMATRTTLGTNLSSEESSKKKSLVNSFQCILEVIVEMMARPWYRIKALRVFYGRSYEYEQSKLEVSGFVGKIIDEKSLKGSEQLQVQDSHTKELPFMELALKHLQQGDFTQKTMQDHCLNMMTGAFETIASTLLHVLILLAMFPQHEERLFEEIDSVIQAFTKSEVTSVDIQNMPYMDAVINETMRVLPTVPIVARELTADMKLPNGVVVPKGVLAIICIFHLHRSKDIWGTDAHTFNPDHFLPSNMENKHAFSFIPFMKGSRNCIGSRYAMIALKITLSKLLRNYRFTTDFNFNDLHFVEDITLKLKEVPLLEVHRRKLEK